MAFSSSDPEKELCYTDHSNIKLDHTRQQCCFQDKEHSPAHVYDNDSTKEFLLKCMDASRCNLASPCNSPSSCSLSYNEEHEHTPDGHHVHQQGCDHEPTSHRDHLDCFTAVSDDSFLLSHRTVRGGKSHQHDFLVENDESQGKSGDDYDHFSGLFLSRCSQNNSTDNIGGIGNRSCADIKTKASLLPNVSQHFLEMSCVDRPSNLQEKQVMMAIDNHGIDAIKLQKTIIDVLGICCPAEAPLIKKILKPVPGVHEISVNVAMKTVTVHHDPITVPPVRLVKLLNSARLEASIHLSGQWKAGHKWPSPYTIASGLLLLVSLFSYMYGPLKWVACGAVAVGLPHILVKGFVSLRRLVLDINVLVLIAVTGALALSEYLEAGAIVFLFTFADWLESRSSDKARLAISMVSSLAPRDAVLSDSGLRVPVTDIKVGTRISVKAGESIPIDGIVASGRSAVDESSLTGESFPIEKAVGAQVWAGTINLTGYICVETFSLAEDSAVARMIRLVEDAESHRSNMEQLVEKCAKIYTPIVLILAIAIAVVPVIAQANDVRHWLYLALTLLVVACPCALVISTPIATTCAIAQAARTGLIIKGGKHLEALGQIRVLAMDKTGTLTEGLFRVIETHPLRDKLNMRELLHWVSSIESKSSHPMASAIVDYARLHGAEPNGDVVDFTILVGEGVRGRVEGHDISIGNERMVDRLRWTEAERGNSSLLERWRTQGLTISWVSVDGTPQLILGAGDQLRTEAAEAMKSIRNLGIQIAILTGDSEAAAKVVQEKLGEIDVYARCLPEHKVEVIQKLKMMGRTGMVGDGINDAPALAAADVGIAMGVAGAAIAMETADIALMKNDLKKLTIAINLSRKARTKIQQNIFLSIATKVVVFVLSAVGHPHLWLAVLADVGTCLAVVFNSMLLLEMRKDGSNQTSHHKHHHKQCCLKAREICMDAELCSEKNMRTSALLHVERRTSKDEISSDLEANIYAKNCCHETGDHNGESWNGNTPYSCDKDIHDDEGHPHHSFECNSGWKKVIGQTQSCESESKCCHQKMRGISKGDGAMSKGNNNHDQICDHEEVIEGSCNIILHHGGTGAENCCSEIKPNCFHKA